MQFKHKLRLYNCKQAVNSIKWLKVSTETHLHHWKITLHKTLVDRNQKNKQLHRPMINM